MGFGEGSIEGEKVFRGAVFPKTLVPAPSADAADCRSLERLVETVERERAAIAELLRSHGAVLFRGFDVRSAEEFDRAVRSFGWEAAEHAGATTRIKMTDRVYTANEAPVDKLINFHHEMSVMKQYPSKIFFFCSEPAPEGGETSIVQSNVVVEKMEERLPEVVAKLKEEGLIYRNTMIKDSELDNSGTVLNKTWKWFFKTDDEAEAEKRAKETLNCSSVTFNSDGSADIAFGPANPIREFGGKRVWFMPFLGYTDDVYDVDNSFGDGSRVPREALVAYGEILEENCVDVKWQRGDILLVDNHTVQHARRPGKPPRVVLVSVCK